MSAKDAVRGILRGVLHQDAPVKPNDWLESVWSGQQSVGDALRDGVGAIGLDATSLGSRGLQLNPGEVQVTGLLPIWKFSFNRMAKNGCGRLSVQTSLNVSYARRGVPLGSN